MNKKNVDAVLSRLMWLFNVNNDSELARSLDINRQTLASWRKRESVPYALCVTIAEQRGVSLDWLLSGRNTGIEKSLPTKLLDVNPRALKWVEIFLALDEEGQKNILQDVEKEKQQTELRQQLKGLKETVERLKNAG